MPQPLFNPFIESVKIPEKNIQKNYFDGPLIQKLFINRKCKGVLNPAYMSVYNNSRFDLQIILDFQCNQSMKNFWFLK